MSEWISVKDELPQDGRFLVYRSNEFPRIDVEDYLFCEDDYEKGFYRCGDMDTNVTHWMPLPDPPKEKP